MRRTATLLLLCSAALLAGCGSDDPAATGDGPAQVETVTGTADSPAFIGGTVNPLQPAPELGLRTWDGKMVRTADYRGKVVLVTFVYANCPDICPLIIDNLSRAKRRLGANGKRVAIVAVSVDPKGDTPKRVRAFLEGHRVLGTVDYLVGNRSQLEAVWSRWGVAARESFDNPALIEHSGVIWGVDPKGRRVTFYPASGFDAKDIAHDVGLMLKP